MHEIFSKGFDGSDKPAFNEISRIGKAKIMGK